MPYLSHDKVRAAHVRPGDELNIGDNSILEFLQVTEVDVKTKWVYITAGDSELTYKFKLDKVVTIVRERPTALEDQRAIRADGIRRIRRYVAEAPSVLEDARKQVKEALEYNSDWHWHHYQDFITAQTMAELWKQVEKIERDSKAGPGEVEYDLYDATKRVMAKVTRELIQTNANTHSSSVMSNAVNAVVMSAKARWFRDLEFVIIGD